MEKTYAEIWRDTEAPEIRGNYIYGTKGLTKMIQFVTVNKIDNNIIDQLMALNPREEGEDMHLVSKFQKALLKHRGNIYKFPHKKVKIKKHGNSIAKEQIQD